MTLFTDTIVVFQCQRLALAHKSELGYRRLNDLFFSEQRHLLPKTISNLQLEPVHSSPNIYKISNFLTAQELDYFSDKIHKYAFQRSYVDKQEDCQDQGTTQQKSTFDNQHRTSSFLSFQKQQDKVISGIEQRAADLLGCWSPTDSIEALQLVRYKKGQFFGVHHDLGNLEDNGHVQLPPKSIWVKRRIATIFCYLNEPDEGGETWFPEASNIRVPPETGSAVLFCNIQSDGMPDPRTVHAGTKVLAGIKYGLNIWICESSK